MDVQFLDAAIGWAIGKNGAVLRTTNGGASWALQTSNTTLDLSGLFAVDGDHAWAVGNLGAIVATSNGGQTWAGQAAAGPWLWDVAFTSLQDGWAVGEGGTLLRTTNGGASWSCAIHRRVRARCKRFMLPRRNTAAGWPGTAPPG